MNRTHPIEIDTALAAPRPSLGTALRQLTDTAEDRTATLARVILGLVMFPHGLQHALGWLGGYGFTGTVGWMTGTLGIPRPLAALAIATELVAPLLLLLGLGSRIAAAGIFGLMLVAAKTHVANGFFMNWSGAHAAGSEGFEYHLLALALAATLVIKGGGAGSVDRMIARGVTRATPPKRVLTP